MGDTPLEYEGHGNWSSQILEQEASHVTSVPDNVLTPLAFGVGTGDELLDFTAPALPVVLESGNYEVILNLSLPVQAGKVALAKVELDVAGADLTFQSTHSLDAIFAGVARHQIVAKGFIPEGGTIKASYQHNAGAPVNVTMAAAISR